MVSTTNDLRLLVSILFFLASPFFGCAAESSMHKIHKDWMSLHGRVYKNLEEYTKKHIIFKENFKRIEEFNAGYNKDDNDDDDRIELDVNQFTDMTNDEFLTMISCNILNTSTKIISGSVANTFIYANNTHIPLEKDWRHEGAVTRVKNQGKKCGCCWAFSVVGAIESINMIKNKKLISLSEQQLIDCNFLNKGCRGGDIYIAFWYIEKNKGIASEAAYPYTGIEGKCKDNVTKFASTISGFRKVPVNEVALLLALVRQPLSVAINTNSFMFQFYRRGVFSGHCSTKPNHALLLIGYGISKTSGKKYWLLKNSWGRKWGEDGYLRIRRDVDKREGMCGIAVHAYYPTMN